MIYLPDREDIITDAQNYLLNVLEAIKAGRVSLDDANFASQVPNPVLGKRLELHLPFYPYIYFDYKRTDDPYTVIPTIDIVNCGKDDMYASNVKNAVDVFYPIAKSEEYNPKRFKFVDAMGKLKLTEEKLALKLNDPVDFWANECFALIDWTEAANGGATYLTPADKGKVPSDKCPNRLHRYEQIANTFEVIAAEEIKQTFEEQGIIL